MQIAAFKKSETRFRRRRAAILLLSTICALCPPAYAQQDQEIQDRGDFRLDIQAGANESEHEVATYLDDKASLETLIQELNNEINLASDITITFAPWPYPGLEPNAGYFPSQRNILISYGLIERIQQMFEGDETYWYPNVEQTVLHEVGHALLHVNGIPKADPNENEEVVADQLAFFIMSEFYDSEDELLPVVELYLARADKSGAANAITAPSEHIPDETRAFNYLCWIEGKSAMFDEKLDDLTESGDCEAKYLALSDGWYDRLEPSFKDQDPEELFHALLEELEEDSEPERGSRVDQAMQAITSEFSEAIAIDIAVRFCSPIPDESCEGSRVLEAWDAFLDGVDDDEPVDQVLEDLRGQGVNGALLTGIAVFWCSPEPGDGCKESRIAQAWRDFDAQIQNEPNPAECIGGIGSRYGVEIAELIALSVCGEPTCFKKEFAKLDSQQLAQVGTLRPRAQPKQGRGGPKFQNRPSASTNSTRDQICSYAIFKWSWACN